MSLKQLLLWGSKLTTCSSPFGQQQLNITEVQPQNILVSQPQVSKYVNAMLTSAKCTQLFNFCGVCNIRCCSSWNLCTSGLCDTTITTQRINNRSHDLTGCLPSTRVVHLLQYWLTATFYPRAIATFDSSLARTQNPGTTTGSASSQTGQIALPKDTDKFHSRDLGA